MTRESEPTMSSIEIRSQVSLTELLQGVSQLDTRELDDFVSQVLTLRARRIAPSLAAEEARLLETVNRRLPTAAQQRFEELSVKRSEETLTAEEHRELLDLIDRIENADAERVRALTSLAQVRGVSVQELMNQLGILPTAHG